MAGIFGPDAELVRQAIAEKQSAEDMQWGNMEPWAGVPIAAAKAGRSIGRGVEKLAGYEDPQIAKAKLLEEAKQEVDSSGVNLLEDSKGYYSKAFEALQKRGLMDEAMGVRQLMLEEESQAAVNVKNMQKNSKGFGVTADGTVYSKDTGDIKEKGTGASSGTSIVTLAPPGSRTRGTGEEKTFVAGSPEAIQAIKEGWVDASKIPNPPRPRDVITVDMRGRNKYVEGMSTKQAESDSAVASAALEAPKLIESSENVIKALDNPEVITGPGADLRLAWAKLMNIAGADNNETIAQTQVLIGRLADTTLNAIPVSNLGGGQGFTERDKEFLISAKAGSINWDKTALQYMAHLTAKGAYNLINARNKMIEEKDPEIVEELAKAGVNMRIQELPKIPPAPNWKNSTKKEEVQTKPTQTKSEDTPNGIDPSVWSELSPRGKELYLKKLESAN